MARTKISEFSATPANNTDIDSINIAEGCAPSGINDAIRELMAQLKDWQSGTSNDPRFIGSSGSLTLNLGTANGVAYLNGSKVVTSGSALTFDGSLLGVSGASTSGFVTPIVAKNPSSNAASGSKIGFDGGGTVWGEVGASYNSNDPYLGFYVRAGSEKMRITDAGNLGLGVTPNAWNVGKALQIGGTDGAAIWGYSGSAQFGNNFYWNGGFLYATTAAASRYAQGSGAHQWYTAPSGTAGNAITFTQAMTLDASGNLLVGTTSQPSSFRMFIDSGANSSVGIRSSASTYNAIIFYTPSTTTAGYIQISGSNTSYVTSSDYRLKNTIAPMTGALEKVALLKPCTYKWNADGSDGEGFIAHELAEVCPQAVAGEKDAINEDGSINAQGIDTSFLVATLTAAIQEQQAIIESLKARLDAANL
jgi:hypothetical protein